MEGNNVENVEVQNNIEPTKKDGIKRLIIVIVSVILVAAGLLCYKVFVLDKKNNTNGTSLEYKEGTAENSVEEAKAYSNYLNKLNSEVSSKYYYDDVSEAHSSVGQLMSSQTVGGYEKLSYDLAITNDKVLMLNDEKIAENVLEFFVIERGQSGAKTLYYIDVNGDLYSVAHEAYLSGYTNLNSKKLSYKNIVSVLPGIAPGHRAPIFIDISGNLYVD